MDARSPSSSGTKSQSREQFLQRRNLREKLDRFIPNRSAMDFDYAHYMLTEAKKGKENLMTSSPYRKLLADTLNLNRTRILAFKNKPPTPRKAMFNETSALVQHWKPIKARRYIPKTSERVLAAPDLLDDYGLSLLDWGSNDVVAIALSNTVYLWDGSEGNISELVTVDDEAGPVTSVKWAPDDGRHIAVGLKNSDIQLWDLTSSRLLRTLSGDHQSQVGALDYRNSHILTTGGMDGRIVNNDVRVGVRSHIVGTYRGHHQEVCEFYNYLSTKSFANDASSPTTMTQEEQDIIKGNIHQQTDIIKGS